MFSNFVFYHRSVKCWELGLSNYPLHPPPRGGSALKNNAVITNRFVLRGELSCVVSCNSEDLLARVVKELLSGSRVSERTGVSGEASSLLQVHVFTVKFSEAFKGQKPAAICVIVGYLHLLLFDIFKNPLRRMFHLRVSSCCCSSCFTSSQHL